MTINEEMKLAAAHALADLAREPVPEVVCEAYGDEPLGFGPRYIIPKPVDARVLPWVSSAVAQAAIETGVAQEPLDIATYRAQLTRAANHMHKASS
jgi:malate dehydrogenase (oxaloacetate-decarboxylating)(NADP+)